MSGKARPSTSAFLALAAIVLALAGGVSLLRGAVPAGSAALVGAALLAQPFLLGWSPLRVPVVMLHSVADDGPRRPPAFPVWCTVAMFEGYLRYLKARGFSTVTLGELHRHLRDGAPLPRRSIVLTFDDGYLDNWVHVAPLLRKYGFTGTVFVPTDFVQEGVACRPTLEDVWAGRAAREDLDVYGYLNGAEIRELARTGTLDVQSHGRTHTWLPVSGNVIGFHHPRLSVSRYLRWMWWNRFPERKPHWFEQIRHADLPWGTPIYEHALALSSPAVRPDPSLDAHLASAVLARGGERLFDSEGWRETLQEEVRAFRATGRGEAVPESRDEFLARLADELRGSRERLEAATGRPVRFMCWPNGGVCPEAFDLLPSCGYDGATLPSRLKGPGNFRGTSPERLTRITATSLFRGSERTWLHVLSFALRVERATGNRYAEIPIKLVWLWRRFRPAPGRSDFAEE